VSSHSTVQKNQSVWCGWGYYLLLVCSVPKRNRDPRRKDHFEVF
jgi:hypothetical protein